MAKVVYKSYNQNDNLLFPPCLGDFIAEKDPVRVLDEDRVAGEQVHVRVEEGDEDEPREAGQEGEGRAGGGGLWTDQV